MDSSTSERRLTTFLDEEEANDYVAPLQKVPENIFNPQYMEDMLTSPSVNKLVKERGLVFEGHDLKTPKPALTKKQPSTKGGAIIPGQSAASKEELAAQLKKAETEGNNQLIASLLETLLSKDLDPKERASYQAQKCQLMLNLGRYSDSQDVALDILRNFSNLSDADLLNVLLALSKSRLELGDIDAGYADLMRAQGILWDWEAKNVHGEKYEELKDETNLESWRDSEVDKDLKAAEELKLLYQLRYAKEANSTSTCYVTGGNTQSYLLGLGDAKEEAFGLKEKSAFKMLPELRNRKVLQVACGDHHTLALVEGDIYNLYNIQGLHKTGNFGNRDIFGWGENSCGQLTGYETQHNIRKPTVIRHFMGKDIQGIHANRAASICYDKDGNVYEWGHRPSGNLSVEVTFTDKNGIQSVRLGNQFSAVLTADDRLLAKGEINQVFVMHEYREIQKAGLGLKEIECGNSHLIALNTKGEMFAFGRNDIGQLGVGEDTKKLAHLTKIEIPAYQSTPSKIFAFKDISAFINTEQELYMWGGIHDIKSDAKAQWRPFQYELDFGTGINRVDGSGNQIFVLDNTGKTYLWDLGTSSKFKRYSLGEHEHFSELASGKGFQVFIKEYIEPTSSYIEVIESENMETFTPVNFRVKLMDRSGPHHYVSGYPLRYYVYVSQQAQDANQLQEKAITETVKAPKPKKTTTTNSNISVLAQGDCIAREAHVSPVEGDDSIQTLQLTLKKNAVNYVYVFINEQLVKDAPLVVDIAKSAHQEEKEQEEQERMRRELELQQAKEAVQQRKMLAAQKENEEKALRIQETEKRAQETLKEHVQQQKSSQSKVEEERKARKEASVGGGYDMSKIKTTPKPSPLEVRSPTMQKAANKPTTSATGSTRSAVSTVKSPSTVTTAKSPTLKMTSPTGLTKGGISTTTPASVNKVSSVTSPLQKPGSAPKTGGLQEKKSPGIAGGLVGKKSPGIAAYMSKGAAKK